MAKGQGGIRNNIKNEPVQILRTKGNGNIRVGKSQFVSQNDVSKYIEQEAKKRMSKYTLEEAIDAVGRQRPASIENMDLIQRGITKASVRNMTERALRYKEVQDGMIDVVAQYMTEEKYRKPINDAIKKRRAGLSEEKKRAKENARKNGKIFDEWWWEGIK